MGLVAVIKDNLNSIRQRYQPLIRAGLSPEFVEGLGNGKWLVTADILRREIEKILAETAGVRLKRCDCRAEGVRLELELCKAGARITLPMTVSVSGLAVNGREQKIALFFSMEPPVGENRLSKIVTAPAGWLLRRTAGKKLAGHPLVVEAAMRRGQGWLVMDLGSLKPLQPLKKTLPLLNMATLDLIAINGAEHVDGGILLRCALTWQTASERAPNGRPPVFHPGLFSQN